MQIIRPIAVTDSGSFTRSTTATYYDKTGTLQTAGINAPRFGYDPAALVPLGLIEEKVATNLLLYSEQIDNAAWTKTNSTISANAAAAPDGNTTADTVTTSVATGGVSQAATVASASAYIFSVFVKAGTSTKIRLKDATSGVAADFDLAAVTGVISAGSGVAKISAIGTAGWYRIRLHFVSTSTTATPAVLNNNGVTVSTFTLWGAQLEAVTSTASYTTSYIQTTTVAVTRAADVNTSGMLSNVAEADYTAYSASTVYKTGDKVLVVSTGVHKVYQSLVGVSGTVTITIATPGVVTLVAHGQAAGTPVSFSTTGALPTGIVAGTVYYILNPTTDAFQIAATVGGSAIATSGTQSGVHTAVASTNYNKTPGTTNTAVWLDSGNDNRWSMFDQSVQSQTTNADAICVAIKPASRLDSVALLNLNAQYARVIVNDPTDGTVYDTTVPLIYTGSIVDWYTYFFEPITVTYDTVLTNLPPYGTSATVNIILYNTGNTVGCGGAIIGLSKQMGTTEYGAKVTTMDYSVKTQDAFGNYTITPRAFSKQGSFTVYANSTVADDIAATLTTYRSTPIVYIGESIYGSTIVYGFYKQFELTLGYMNAESVYQIDVEGLT